MLLAGDLAHFHENYEANGVPSFNTDARGDAGFPRPLQEDRRESQAPSSSSTIRATSASCRHSRGGEVACCAPPVLGLALCRGAATSDAAAPAVSAGGFQQPRVARRWHGARLGDDSAGALGVGRIAHIFLTYGRPGLSGVIAVVANAIARPAG